MIVKSTSSLIRSIVPLLLLFVMGCVDEIELPADLDLTPKTEEVSFIRKRIIYIILVEQEKRTKSL